MVSTCLADGSHMGGRQRVALPLGLEGLLEQAPFTGMVEALIDQPRAQLPSGIRYVIFVVMPGDGETLCLLTKHVLSTVE